MVKVPRFAFEKFRAADPTLTTTMKSVGEAMAIGRCFTEALQKALRSLEKRDAGFHWTGPDPAGPALEALLEAVRTPTEDRLVQVQQAIRGGASVEALHEATGIDPWFLDQILAIHEIAVRLREAPALTTPILQEAKRHGFSDAQLGVLRGMSEDVVRGVRQALGVRPVYKTVDTCAAEFAAATPYHYSSYDSESEVTASDRRKVIILGSGPNRIGQGVEFDYSCVHASFALREAGFETVMINCNPETVSTDYDTSDRLYFEPLTLEDVLEVVRAEQAAGEVIGVVVQLGGQTPLGLAAKLEAAGVPIVGTSPAAIHLAEERGAFGRVLAQAGLMAPEHGMASSFEEAKLVADRVGYPVLVRPSYVLGGRGMEIVFDETMLADYIERATKVSPEHPVLVDRFLGEAIEIDVDALFDGEQMYLGGIMEHIEEAGVHSGDSACVLPPATLSRREMDGVREATEAIARGVGVRGLLNVQFALAAGRLYVLEANPRASRTAPFVSKATGVPLAKAAARVMLGASIGELRAEGMLPARGDGGTLPEDAPVSVKEAVLPFRRFRTLEGKVVDTLLGPEMRSTGEVMGIAADFPTAFAKSQLAAYGGLPDSGSVFVSVADLDKRSIIFPVKRLVELGFTILATEGTANLLRRNGIAATEVRKHSSGPGPNGEPTVVDMIHAGEVDMVVNTPSGPAALLDGYDIRAAITSVDRPIITTVQQLAAAVQAIEAARVGGVSVASLQEHGETLRRGRAKQIAEASPPVPGSPS